MDDSKKYIIFVIEKKNMTKTWEYKTKNISNFYLQAELRDLGMQGWELVSRQGEKCVFKREKKPITIKAWTGVW